MAIKQVVCKFCGKTCDFSTHTKRWYEVGTRDLHVRNCPKRARHYHEVAMDASETERQNRFAEYNRKGTEDSEGRRFVEGLEMLDDEEE